MLWDFIWGGIKALFAPLWSRLFGTREDPRIKEAEHERDEAKHGEAVFAAPARDRAAVDDILRRHAGE